MPYLFGAKALVVSAVLSLCALFAAGAVLSAQSASGYHIAQTFRVGGDGSWDYVVPDPPQTTMFHVHVRRPLEALDDKALELAERTKTWFAGGWQRTEDPAVQKTELSLGVLALDVDPAEVAALYTELVAST